VTREAKAALDYAAMGYSVLPLAPGEKRPYSQLVPHGLKHASRLQRQIERWWRDAPTAGVGILPPAEVLVLDLDDPGLWEKLRSTYPELEEAPRQRTPRGGYHVFSRLPPGLEGALSATARKLKGLDLRGMERAYVVAAPTRLKVGSYKWERPLVTPSELPEAPAGLLLQLLPPPPKPPAPLRLSGSEGQSPKRLRALLESYAQAVAAAPEGNRHNTLVAYARAAGGLIPYGLDANEAENALVTAATSAGLPEREASETTRWGLQVGQRAPLHLEERPRLVRGRGVQVAQPSPAQGDESEWPTPKPIGDLEIPLPEWGRGLLPPKIEELAEAIAQNLAVGAVAPALAMLGAVSGVLVNRGVFISPNGASWKEPVALWVVLIGPPGVGKTPILRLAANPLWDIEKALQEDHRVDCEAYEANLAAWQEAKKGERGKKPEAPPERRLVTADATPEKLALLLKENPGLIAVLDELKGLLLSWRKESVAPGRAFFLACYHGTSHVVDRIARGTLYLDRPALGLLGGLQTGPWSIIVQEAESLGQDADGLLQRFTPVLIEPTTPRENPPLIPENLLEDYRALVRDIWKSAQPTVLHLSEEARAEWARWQYETQKAARNPELPETWRAYLGKRLSLTLRLAGVLAALEGEKLVSDEVLSRAITLVSEILEPHARRAWRVGEVGDLAGAHRLAKRLESGEKIEQFTLRELYRKEIAGITKANEARQAVEVLERAGWVRWDSTARVYRVNPRVQKGG